jgi:crotonobetainyl-CoA:carnitine CoA-transferase CaiB-like acyl-CoA transferase
MSGMLAGIRVVSFTHFLQGPSACQMLADLGAEVIKIEPAGGAFERSWTGPGQLLAGYSPFFALANRNVRSIVVDLKHADGVATVRRLVDGADVLVESFRPGTMDRLGLGWSEVSASNPRLVYASLSGYGSDGPYRDRPGQDVLIQALSGLAMATGRGGQPPTPVGACVVDQHAAVLGAFGILAALHGRERSGVGTLVESNLLNAALDLQIEPLGYRLNGFEPSRSSAGVSSPFYTAPYGVFATADSYLCLSLTSPATLAAVFGDDWFASVPATDLYARREEVNERVATHMATRTSDDWSDHLTAHRVWFAPVQDYDQVLADPQVLHNDSFDAFDHPAAGEVRVLKHPISYGGSRPGIRTAPPDLGADTDDVMREVGLDEPEIARLRDAGAIG